MFCVYSSKKLLILLWPCVNHAHGTFYIGMSNNYDLPSCYHYTWTQHEFWCVFLSSTKSNYSIIFYAISRPWQSQRLFYKLTILMIKWFSQWFVHFLSPLALWRCQAQAVNSLCCTGLGYSKSLRTSKWHHWFKS